MKEYWNLYAVVLTVSPVRMQKVNSVEKVYQSQVLIQVGVNHRPTEVYIVKTNLAPLPFNPREVASSQVINEGEL